MPYCYVEDMSIVASLCVCVCVCVRASSSPGALFSLKQYGVTSGAFFLFRSMVLCCYLMFLRCDVRQVEDTCEKSFTNNSSRWGVCVCVRACVCVCLKSENREGSLQTIMVHFFSHLPVDVLFFKNKMARHEST